MSSIGNAICGIIGIIGVIFIIGISNSKKQTNRQNEENKKIYQAQQEREKYISEAKRSLEQIKQNRREPSECFINIKNEERAYGLNASIFYLCIWEPYNDNKEKIPDLIQQYIYENVNGGGVGASINISLLEQAFTAEIIKKISNEKEQKELAEKGGRKFISWKKLEVESVKGTQTICKKVNKEGTMYFIENHFYCGIKMLSISYFVSAKTDIDAKSLLKDYTPIFEFLVNKTTFN